MPTLDSRFSFTFKSIYVVISKLLMLIMLIASLAKFQQINFVHCAHTNNPSPSPPTSVCVCACNCVHQLTFNICKHTRAIEWLRWNSSSGFVLISNFPLCLHDYICCNCKIIGQLKIKVAPVFFAGCELRFGQRHFDLWPQVTHSSKWLVLHSNKGWNLFNFDSDINRILLYYMDIKSSRNGGHFLIR